MTGAASLVELHYTTSLQDADLTGGSVGATTFQFGNLLNRVDALNLTVGLHTEIRHRTAIRVAGVFPLLNGPEKPFDSEIHLGIERRF